MNQLQKQYALKKAEWDTALENISKISEDTLDAIEDDLIDAEEALVEWSIQVAEKAGMTKEDADALRKNRVIYSDQLIDKAMRLNA
ncbi:hypothetical protein [Halobacillus karajensis]|uniref:hypothetical protein n=1 Tax=Halobacillus karajensis TaxID=195088 RepID=UPI00045CF4A1|nr:hypothetical protein [Halobacillus karajensis]CDQ21680.1 hypothetical protein BN982_04089 [Halobacillus karajensis]